MSDPIVQRDRRRPNRASRLLAIAFLASASLGVASPGPISAATYDDTNPGATPCGDGSHTVTVWRSFLIKSGGLIYARIEIRRSEFCNTVWTRAVNLTGSGSGYASARSLTTDEKITVYSCPLTSCQKHTETETGDVLPSKGSTGWSHQFVLPTGTTLGSPASKQPPTVRGVVTVHTGGSVFSFDTAMEPVWSWWANGFKNERNLRNDNTVMSCDNNRSRCVWWGSSAPLLYELDTSLIAPPGPADLVADLKNTILPAWSDHTATSPGIFWCTAPCSEDVMLKVVPPTDPDIAGNVGVTVYDGGYSSGTPALFLHITVKYLNKNYDHGCGTLDDGCGPGTDDDRPVLSHEVGHTIGLGHCDLDSGVMCHAKGSASNEVDQGTLYWTPQKRDIWATKAYYP